MKDSNYRVCQECKYAFKLRKCSRSSTLLFCPRCNSNNIALVDKKIYDVYNDG